MGIIIKSRREIELMREAGRLVCRVLDRMSELVAPGMTTGELNDEAEAIIAKSGATALFKGVQTQESRFAFPAALCTSVNEEVVHGVPGERRLEEGDIVSIDCGVRLNGYCGDSARTFAVGNVSEDTQRLLDVTRKSLELAVSEMKPERRWSEVAARIQSYVEGERFSVVRKFVGHGIGQEMHEDPKVPNYWERRQAETDFELRPGMTLAIEPMVNMGRPAVRYADESCWAVVTKDGRYAAHFEHTVALNESGVDILTNGD
ncbi:MAG: type I methionyl aminopeptidase [Planctomycetes bacterium]|nr:type I methionyl aminopeptidase [Planctomycetota bacterium]